mmetsp:Transcript_12315/g.33860  ORF Transcript_12315/g.33860 Transcript_12315/m.33860 type:complete len:118 (-) Transcript_12315:250-603(-)
MAFTGAPEFSSEGDLVVFSQKVLSGQNSLIRKLCWERCVDTMDMSTEDSQLPSAAKRCADICTHKFTDTAMLVSAETQLWQMEAFRQQQSAALMSRAIWGVGALCCTVGLGAYLFRE